MEISTRIDPRRLRSGLISVAVLLMSLSFSVALVSSSVTLARVGRVERLAVRLLQNFNAGIERSVPTAFTLVLLLACATVLGLCAVLHERKELGSVGHWWGLAGLFLLFTADEFLSIHEQVAVPLRRTLRGFAGGLFYFGWVLPGAVLVVGIVLLFRNFARELPATTRKQYLLSAALFIVGAIGMEMVGGLRMAQITRASGDPHSDILYVFLVTLRQGMEMIGVSMFLAATVEYLMMQARLVRFTVSAPRNGRPRGAPAPAPAVERRRTPRRVTADRRL